MLVVCFFLIVSSLMAGSWAVLDFVLIARQVNIAKIMKHIRKTTEYMRIIPMNL